MYIKLYLYITYQSLILQIDSPTHSHSSTRYCCRDCHNPTKIQNERKFHQHNDELLLECQESKAQEYMLSIKKAMEEVVPFDPPLLVEASRGTNWAEL